MKFKIHEKLPMVAGTPYGKPVSEVVDTEAGALQLLLAHCVTVRF